MPCRLTALFNLVDNAVKFTPAGGRVAVGCGQGGSLLQVRDTGPGIPPEERAEICKRFFRSERTKDVMGLGLGLSITATIIDLHGFSLDVADACPGAIFSINARGATVGAIGMLRSELEHAVAMRETG